MGRLDNLIDKWMFNSFDDISSKGLSAFRVFFSAYLLIVGDGTYARLITPHNQVLYDPKRSLAVFFELPSQTFFIGLDYLILILLVLVLVGYQTRWSTLLLGICFLIGKSFEYSFGKISHGELLVMLTPIIFSFSNWGAYYSIDSKSSTFKKIHRWPITLFVLLFAIAMFSAGLEKIEGGWLLIKFDAVRYIMYRGLLYEKIGILTELTLNISSGIFWELIDYSVVIFEVGFLIAIIKANWFRFWIILAVIFHLSVWVFMDVTFSDNLICYLLFINWGFVLDRLKLDIILERIYSRIKLLHVGLAVVIMSFIKWQFMSPYLLDHLRISNDLFTYSIFMIALVLVFGSVYHFYQKRKLKIGHE